MSPIFTVQKKIEQGTTNPMSARLTVQVINLLQACGADQKLSQEIVTLYTFSLVGRLARCAEIEARIRGHIEKGKAAFKPSSGAAQMLPHVPNLKEDCENYLNEFRGFLVDLLKVFNLLYGTDYSEASEWTTKTQKHKTPVATFAVERNLARPTSRRGLSLKQKTGLEPFVWMRNAATHPARTFRHAHRSRLFT